LHAGRAAAATAGIDGWRLVPVDTQNGLELASPGRRTLVTNLAALIVDAGRDDGVQAMHDMHGVITSALLRDAMPLFNDGIMTTDHRAHAAAVTPFFVDHRRII
jgi:hypothetical protein